MAAASRSTRAIPIRRPDQPSAPSSPKPVQQSTASDHASRPHSPSPPGASSSSSSNNNNDQQRAMLHRFRSMNLASSAPVFVPKSSQQNKQEDKPSSSSGFNPNSRPFTPEMTSAAPPSSQASTPSAAGSTYHPVPSTSQLQPTAPDFQFSPERPPPLRTTSIPAAAAAATAPSEFVPQAPVFQPRQQQQHQQTPYEDLSSPTPQHEGFMLYPEVSQEANPEYYAPAVGHQPEPYMQRMPLYYHLYQPPLPHISSHNPQQLALHSFFISPTLREDLQKRAEALVPVDGLDIPGYFSLVALDTPTHPSTNPKQHQQIDQSAQQSGLGLFGVRNWVYKAVSEKDGKPYIVRRLENFKLPNDQALSVVEKWRRIRHPNLVHVREAFTTRAFGDPSVVFVYDIHPLAKTLFDSHLSQTALSAAVRNTRPGKTPHLPERVLWSYIIQLANVIATVHAHKLAVRTIELSKILVTGRHRLRVSGCGMLDVIRCDWNNEETLPKLQHADFLDLGAVILALACNTPHAVYSLSQSMDRVSKIYSPDVHNLLMFLFTKQHDGQTIDQLFVHIGSRVLDELNGAFSQSDILESEMMREVENGRLVRLLTKFGFINERPEFDHDPRWAESGDRYLIKLFRDYVFHQVDDAGRPVLDLSHVLTCLNKLDAGIEDKVMLVSRDSQSCLVVSYREIKKCIEAAYQDLSR